MNYNRQITISTGNSRKATSWPPSTLWWSELVAKLATPIRSTETLREYLALPGGKQAELKDVGGFVAGTLAGSRRKAGAVAGRDVLTLDLDHIPAGGTENVLKRLEGLGCAYCVYSTRRHEPAAPRLRVLIPLYRTCTADEYEPLARRAAEWIGIELCDGTTFEASRLMYWPSCSADSQYVYHYADSPFFDPNGVLATYADWRDTSSWPHVPGAQEIPRKLAVKQGDPTLKKNLVGAFCRVYDVYAAMDAYLPGVYEPTDTPGRYTFANGSTTGGAVVYDKGLFLFSHHATDPCSGRLVNAFDLVRLHLYGDMDDDAKEDTPTNRLPSFTAMTTLALGDETVSTLLKTDRYQEATAAFDTVPDEMPNWIGKLAVNASGVYLRTVDNVLLILENDPNLKGKLAFDEFANRGLALGALPWDGREGRRQWTDTDDAGLRHYVEKVYGITGKERVLDATALCAFKLRINDVKEFLTTLTWDGVKRLDTLLIDYLGAENNVYTRAVIRKSLVAAVARAMTPGVKYDYTPILVGPQGIGKSSFIRLLALNWFSDSLNTFEGKEARELIQGTWINELGELNGLTKSETNAVKQFLSQQEDIYREPYGRRTNRYPRRCVFFGTTNDAEFLRDVTGNRRFWPVDVGLQAPAKSIFRELEQEAPQIWAEAYCYWQMGEPLFLEGEAEAIAKEQQEIHRESHALEGIIREFLERPVPSNWDRMEASARRMYWADPSPKSGEAAPRDKVCVAEIWCECLGGDIKHMKRSNSNEITGVLIRLPDWERHQSTQRFGPYGVQKGFVRSCKLCKLAHVNQQKLVYKVVNHVNQQKSDSLHAGLQENALNT